MESYYAELDGMMYAHLEYIEQFDSPFLLSVRDSNKFIIDNIVNSKFNNKFDNWNINFPIYSITKRLQQNFPVIYTMTAPYTHEYCISSYKCDYIEKTYCESVTAKDWYNELPTKLYKYMLRNHPDFDYKELQEKIKLTIKDNKIKDVNGSTYRGQPTSDEALQTLKYELVNHLPITKDIFMHHLYKENLLIKEDFEKLYDKYLKEV